MPGHDLIAASCFEGFTALLLPGRRSSQEWFVVGAAYHGEARLLVKCLGQYGRKSVHQVPKQIGT